MQNHPVLENFKNISRIPRCSKKEKAIREYLTDWAKTRGFAHKSDAAGNLVIYVPANVPKTDMPTIILQSHMDMVCEKTPEATHNFDTDPLDLYIDGDWLKARGTSLGADNGIGMAYALTAAESAHPHPPLELLFTVDEETGLTGALELEQDLLQGTIMFNMDSEDENALIIGCASGRSREITAGFATAPLAEGAQVFSLSLNNLLGGHSGIEIHKQNANANKLICGFLRQNCDDGNLQLLHYQGGSAMNAIPRDGEAVFAVKQRCEGEILKSLEEYTADIQKVYPQEKIEFKLCKMTSADEALSMADTLSVLDLIMLLPHGVLRVEPLLLPPQTETSCNMGPISIAKGHFSALLFIRSSNEYQGNLVAEQCGILAKRLGFYINVRETDTGAWQPKWDAPLLAHCRNLYMRVMGREPKIQVIHAGLECGVIIGKYPQIDVLSFGPDQFGAHSPSERLNIPSALRIWDFLQAVLQAYT